jgi:hypothetical protein
MHAATILCDDVAPLLFLVASLSSLPHANIFFPLNFHEPINSNSKWSACKLPLPLRNFPPSCKGIQHHLIPCPIIIAPSPLHAILYSSLLLHRSNGCNYSTCHGRPSLLLMQEIDATIKFFSYFSEPLFIPLVNSIN